jgi:hypothetical protein
MSGAVVVRNLKEVIASLEKVEGNIEKAAQMGVAMAGLAVQRQAQINANNGTRSRQGGKVIPPRHIGPSGSGPNVITGALKRSISTRVRVGFGTYIAEVGPSVVYARAVELGSPMWKSGVKYPYLTPAAERLIKSGELQRIFSQRVAQVLRGK